MFQSADYPACKPRVFQTGPDAVFKSIRKPGPITVTLDDPARMNARYRAERMARTPGAQAVYDGLVAERNARIEELLAVHDPERLSLFTRGMALGFVIGAALVGLYLLKLVS